MIAAEQAVAADERLRGSLGRGPVPRRRGLAPAAPRGRGTIASVRRSPLNGKTFGGRRRWFATGFCFSEDNMGRTYLAGAISVEEDSLREAKRRPFLGIYVEGRSGDVYLREKSLSDLKLRESRYDARRGIWFFKVELHDDDLPNASYAPLDRFLETVPSVPGSAFVAARDDWQDEFSWFALVIDGRARNLMVSNQAGSDLLVTREQAAELIARLNWPPSYEVIEAL